MYERNYKIDIFYLSNVKIIKINFSDDKFKLNYNQIKLQSIGK